MACFFFGMVIGIMVAHWMGEKPFRSDYEEDHYD
jgi:hypothetical protein